MEEITIDVNKLIAEAEKLSKSERSCWGRGVASIIRDYAAEVLEEHDGEEVSNKEFFEIWNCGAETLKEAVYGGCFDIWNFDIAHRLCTPSELRKTNEGMKEPNARESWLDVELRAVYQAISKSFAIMKEVKE